MAGIGDAWGTREELLHPRDKHGRFRSKWKMAEGVVDKITSFLSSFSPRTFQSDQQAAQYAQNLGGKKRFSLGEIARLHADYAPAQEDMRDGVIDDPSTRKFTQMMDSHAIELPDDVIVSRVVGPDAFGLTPATMNAEEGGLEDFTGKKIADRGYSAVNLGTPLGGGSGQITMSIAVPKGTKATLTGQGGNDRSMYLQPGQAYRITKVTPDGRGGYYMLAVAETGNTETPNFMGGHVGAGKPSNREGAVRDLQRAQAERMKAEGDQPSTAPTPVGDGGQPQTDNTPQAQPTLPDGTQPRTEPVAAESIGGGPAPGAPASEAPAAPQPTVPETPAPAAGPPLEDADVAKLRLRRDSKARYQEMARAAPVAQAMASLSELDSKKVDDKAKAAEIRRILASPVMDEVPKESVGIRADLEQVARDFEAGKPNLAKARMTRLSKNQGLTSGDKAGSVVDFDEATMDPVGDIPEDGKVEILRPAITKEAAAGPGAPVLMERAQVTGAITPSARKATKKTAPSKAAVQRAAIKKNQEENDRGRAAAAKTMVGKDLGSVEAVARAVSAKEPAPAKKTAPAKKARTSNAEDAAITILLERIGQVNPAAREEILGQLSPEMRKEVEAAQVRHKERMTGLAAKKAAAPAVKKAAAPVVKKAAPAKPEAAPGGITDKTTVADLKKIAADRGVDIKGLRLKKDIRDRIEGKSTPAPTTPATGNDAKIQELLGKKPTVADLKKYAQDNGITVDKSRPLKADWVDAILSHKPGSTPEAPVKKVVPAKKVTPPAPAAPPAPVKKAAPRVTHGFRPLDTPERKADFKEAWIKAGFQKEAPVGQQNSELNDTFVRLRQGRYSPQEAIDNLEDIIAKNKDHAAGLDAGLREDMPERDREYMKGNLEKLRAGIAAQEKASGFLRKYFAQEEKKAPPAPPPPPVAIAKTKPEGAPVRHIFSQVTDGNGRIIKLDRPKADEPLHLPNHGSDQGLMHLDSELGTLWTDLYKDPREPNSFINEIARTGDALGSGQVDLNEVLKRLRALKEKAGDKGVEARIEEAIKGIDAPPVKVPTLPDEVPAPVKKYLEELAKIPTARKTGRIGGSRPDKSVLDSKIDAIRDFVAGKIRAHQLEQELNSRNLHESSDGAFAMWKLGERLMSRDFQHYEKDANGKTIVVSEPNPDWPAIQAWLRSERTRKQN